VGAVDSESMPTPVLVVDDSPVSRKMLMKVLPPEWDIEITQAGNGEEALAALKIGNHRVVLLDLNMPVMDGYQFLEALQGTADRPMVIVLSGDIQPLAQERVRALGALAFMKKPVRQNTILDTLKACNIL
jgi:two-component system, chemotaxis family, chemotaxis protein CheY